LDASARFHKKGKKKKKTPDLSSIISYQGATACTAERGKKENFRSVRVSRRERKERKKEITASRFYVTGREKKKEGTISLCGSARGTNPKGREKDGYKGGAPGSFPGLRKKEKKKGRKGGWERVLFAIRRIDRDRGDGFLSHNKRKEKGDEYNPFYLSRPR